MAKTYSTIADRRRRGTYDAALELRDTAAAAISATTNGTAIQFPARKYDDFKVCFNIAAYSSYAAGTAEWVLTVEVSATSGGSYTTIGTVGAAIFAGAAGETEIVFGGDEVADKLSTAEWIRVTATKTGSPGSLSFGSWIVSSS